MQKCAKPLDVCIFEGVQHVKMRETARSLRFRGGSACKNARNLSKIAFLRGFSMQKCAKPLEVCGFEEDQHAKMRETSRSLRFGGGSACKNARNLSMLCF
jgi:hypothetical protein